MLKTVITLGPSSSGKDVIMRLLPVANKFRLNTSHINDRELDVWLLKLKEIFKEAGHQIPVVIDLQGGKMRIGKYPSCEKISGEVTIFLGTESTSSLQIPVPHESFFSSLEIGDIISLNDSKITMEISKVFSNKAEGKVLQNGPLSSNKGINRKKHPLEFAELTKKDKKIIQLSLKYDFTEFAFSFTYNGAEADIIRPYTKDRKLIAKIERPETFEYLNIIDLKFNEIWLCRGDLGAQAGIFALGVLQKKFVAKIKGMNNNCFLAGQVLEHMTHFKNPTRSEIVHLHDIRENGFAGIVLSDETAIGKNIPGIADFLKQLRNKT